jgi:hypothetical protein
MLEFSHPIPVVTEQGEEGYAIYVESGGSFENDLWCVALCDGGIIRHYNTSQLRIHQNLTLQINKKNGEH